MACSNCPMRDKCREICPNLEALLPKLHETDFQGCRRNYEYLGAVLRQVGESKLVLGLRRCLQGREREVVDLIFNDSLTLEQVARVLHTSVENVIHLREKAFVRMGREMIMEKGGKHGRRVSG